MKSSEIRQKFLEFFQASGHHIASSASLVPADPTMLLTGAGMVPFKPVFLGKDKVDYTRAASVQKCVRTTDIEMIGRTGRHLSFFEMLGNFSFGDYYKQEAITWAWELLTKVYKLDPDRLWATVFTTDDEAADIWRDSVGLPAQRIVRLGEKDNFWSAGPTGPCGPSSEIHFDQGPDLECGRPACAPGCDCDRYLEIWNLVFMQYNRDENGELHPLPKKNIDTGMGLERITSVLQGVHNNYETDLIFPIVKAVCALAGVVYGAGLKTDVSLKIIADHSRAITFMIGDGILPGNDGRGYILRRLIRRAVRHGRLLGIETGFLGLLIDEISDIMSGHYSEIGQNVDFIKTIAAREEERFARTLRQGLAILAETIEKVKTAKERELPPDAVFKLYDTYGFPLELTEEIAAESELAIDKAGFETLMEAQRTRARAKAGGGHAELYVSNIYHQIKDQIGASEFVGYEADTAEAKILALAAGDHIKMDAVKGDKIEVFLNKSPFYAEKGGQTGDSGVIVTATGKIKIFDTEAPVADLISHQGEVIEGHVRLGQTTTATLDSKRRMSIARNHTATHLLHWALRAVLGAHVKQAGSLVEAERLRFDFNHHEPLTVEQVREIERLVNEKIIQNQPVRAFETTIDYAKEAGALAFFADKYGRFVRLVEVGNFSKELCGGVHAHNTSEVGYVKVLGEFGIGANTRRIEAVTGEEFLKYLNNLEATVAGLSGLVKAAPGQEVQATEALVSRLEQVERELAKLRDEKYGREAERIAAGAEKLDGVFFYAGKVMEADADSLRMMA
ncbi:MAG: alanine--tRNA ligase, partial [Actinomycetota bacterium]|nr:alanine--tRNA ligase [Actinomycetota bacterium]